MGFDTRRINFNLTAVLVTTQALSHLAATGISRTEK